MSTIAITTILDIEKLDMNAGPSTIMNSVKNKSAEKNAGHNMAIVGEPCNVDAHANNPGLFMTMLCPQLCVRLYCTPVHTDCDCTAV